MLGGNQTKHQQTFENTLAEIKPFGDELEDGIKIGKLAFFKKID